MWQVIKTKRKALTLLVLCFASILLADDFKTIDGKEYKNVTVNRVEPDGLRITHSTGVAKILFTALPKYLQEKYYHDRVAAAAADSAAAQAAEEKRRAKQKASEDERARMVRPSGSVVPVPNVVGWDLKRGWEEISNVGLVPKVAGGKRSGKITKLRPPGGTQVSPRSPVTVWVSTTTPPWVAIVLCALAAIAVAYLLAEIWRRLHPPKVELCPVLDPGDQKLEKVGPLVAAGGG